MRLTRIRLFAAAALLSTPFGIIVCNNLNQDKSHNDTRAVKPLVTKPVDIDLKKATDETRKLLEQKERKFAKEISGFNASELPNLLFCLYMVSENDNEIFVARNIAKKLCKRHDELRELTNNDFSIQKPDEEQLEAFTRCISMGQKGTLLISSYSTMTLEEISKKIESDLKTSMPELTGKKLKEEVEHYLEYFKLYQEGFANICKLRDDLYKSMKDFNQEVQKLNKPAYEPVWGITSRYLNELK